VVAAHLRRTVARVNLAAIERNSTRLAGALSGGAQLCAVVKSDGYGHGASSSAQAALVGGAQWIAVTTAPEAAALRADDIEGRILIMGALAPSEIDIAEQAEADVTAWDEAFVAALAGRRLHVHVKLDTGMGRLGTRDVDQARRTIAAVDATRGLELAGVMTHFATADELGDAFLGEQLAAFTPFVDEVKANHPHVIAHAANSAATLREPLTHFDMVRCGVAVYGMDPFQRDPAEQGLEPALELRSYVAAVKAAAPGQSAGYGRRFIADAPTTLATVPIGYGDGVRRALTNNAEVLIRGRRHPLVGAVSMDNVTIDLGPDTDVEVYDEVILIGDGLLAEEMARRLDTINYEITCGLTGRVPRVYHRDDR
jgi:alanine racemase